MRGDGEVRCDALNDSSMGLQRGIKLSVVMPTSISGHLMNLGGEINTEKQRLLYRRRWLAFHSRDNTSQTHLMFSRFLFQFPRAIFLTISLSLSIYLCFISLFVCLSVFQSIFLSSGPFLSIFRSIYLYIYVSILLSIFLSINVSIFLSIFLSI